MKRITIVSILILALLRLALLSASAAGATEYRINIISTPHGAPACYSFDDWGRSTRALTRVDNGQWYVQVPASHSLVLFCEGYEWIRVPNAPSIVLTMGFSLSQTAYHDPQGLPHDVSASVCRYAPRLGVPFCYTPDLELSVEPDGAWYSTMVTDGWQITTTRIDGVRYNEYTLLTRTPDGRVITDPSDPSEFTPWCMSFDGRGQSTRALVRWEERLHSWRIRIDERFDYALYCDDRDIGVIEDADRGMPGAVLIMNVVPMQTVMLYRDTDRQAVVSAVNCTSPDSEWTRWEGVYCYDAEVWTESAPDGSLTEWYTNVTDGWTVQTQQEGAATGSIDSLVEAVCVTEIALQYAVDNDLLK